MFFAVSDNLSAENSKLSADSGIQRIQLLERMFGACELVWRQSIYRCTWYTYILFTSPFMFFEGSQGMDGMMLHQPTLTLVDIWDCHLIWRAAGGKRSREDPSCWPPPPPCSSTWSSSPSSSFTLIHHFGFLKISLLSCLFAPRVGVFDISISHINCRYIDTFWKYRYRYQYRYDHSWKYRYWYR